MSLEFLERLAGSRPADWTTVGGAPARCLPHDGMPSHESDHRKLLIFELMVVGLARGDATLDANMLPVSYGKTSVLAPGGLAPLHHGEEAMWVWRPCPYVDGLGEREGSQREIMRRYLLSEVMGLPRPEAGDAKQGIAEALAAYLELEVRLRDAEKKAKAILTENLTPQQRIEFAVCGKFRCRGGKTGNLYLVEWGNGFAILDKQTNQIAVSYCLHPDQYIPQEDTMLAQKLALEDPELEEDYLENARLGWTRKSRSPTADDLHAAGLERELIS